MSNVTAALVAERGGSVVLTPVSMRAPGAGEIAVRIAASGVCPTDLFGIDGGAGDVFPALFGHEGAGVVEETGAGVTAFRPGDRVLLGFDSCGDCSACRSGRAARCERFGALNYHPRTDAVRVRSDGRPVRGGWMAQSSWSTHVIVRERAAVALPADVPWDVAAALGCGTLTGTGTVFNVLRPGAADALLVIGAGTTGLTAVMAAAHRGARTIIACENDPVRRELALQVGATHACSSADLAAARTDLPAVTMAVDTVGTVDTITAALSALAPGGRCVTVALKPGRNVVQVSQSALLWGRSLEGVIEGDADLRVDVPRLVALWRAGGLPVERLITRFDFADAAAAVAAARAGTAIKPVLMFEDASSTAGAEHEGGLVARMRAGDLPDGDLPGIWSSLPAVRPDELRGLWRGWAVSRGHRVQRRLDRSAWYGKLFTSDDEVAPLVCRTPDDTLRADVALAGGGASLRSMAHLGVVTAAMVYDTRPIIDLFVRLSPTEVLGVMTGRDTDDDGRPFFFVLERDPLRSVES